MTILDLVLFMLVPYIFRIWSDWAFSDLKTASNNFFREVQRQFPDKALIREDHDVVYFKDTTSNKFVVFYLQLDGTVKRVDSELLPEFRWG